jgi:hypothetical protein
VRVSPDACGLPARVLHEPGRRRLAVRTCPASSELLLNDLEFLVGHVIELNEPGPCPFDAVQQFVELLSVLRVLDQENHQECDDRRARVDEELAGVRLPVRLRKSLLCD